MRIRLSGDDAPNKIVSKIVPLATEKSKSSSLIAVLYNWMMRRLGFNVAENDSERRIRVREALKGAVKKQKGAGNIMERLKQQRSERESEPKEGDDEGNPKKKLSLVEKIKAQQKLEEEQKAKEASKKTDAATSKPEAPPEALKKAEDARPKPERKPSALERLRSVAGGGKKEEKKEEKKEDEEEKK
jgi:hypothetical protein